jgi:hypothetical protein
VAALERSWVLANQLGPRKRRYVRLRALVRRLLTRRLAPALEEMHA